MKLIKNTLGRFSIAHDLLAFFWKERIWWMIPLIIILLLLGILMFLSQTTPVGPFIYTLFQYMQILRNIWKSWKRISRIIGVFESRLILTIFYFIFLLPAGIIFSLFQDPLKIKHPNKSTWIGKKSQSETLEEMKRQY